MLYETPFLRLLDFYIDGICLYLLIFHKLFR